jgi:EAL and modified HD-GYP domain-containing signal transduction protein
MEKAGESTQQLALLLLELNLPAQDLYALQLEAFDWGNSLLPSYAKRNFA